MLCKTLLGQAVQPLWGQARVSHRSFSAFVQGRAQQLSTPAQLTKPDNRGAASSPRGPTPGSSRNNFSTSTTPAAAGDRNGAPPMSERIYTNFTVYKSRTALAARLLPPAFTTSEAGYKTLDRDGVMLLEFANANPGQPTGGGAPPPAGGINRTYNWGAKITFALSPVELGELLAGDKIASDKGLVLFHDPAKLGKSGEPLKKLALKQLADGAISFNLSAGPDSISVPVSRGEFEVLKSLAHFAIPRLLGFDAAFASLSP